MPEERSLIETLRERLRQRFTPKKFEYRNPRLEKAKGFFRKARTIVKSVNESIRRGFVRERGK